jgi:hypothetical protein
MEKIRMYLARRKYLKKGTTCKLYRNIYVVCDDFRIVITMTPDKVGYVSLHNGGGFVVKMEFKYTTDNVNWKTSKQTDSFPLGKTKKVDPGDLGVPDGSTIILKAIVVAGKDNEAQQQFIYEKGNPATAAYTITGTTLSNTLGLIGIQLTAH